MRYARMAGSFYVYILASRRNGTLYVGVTDDLARRMTEHKAKQHQPAEGHEDFFANRGLENIPDKIHFG